MLFQIKSKTIFELELEKADLTIFINTIYAIQSSKQILSQVGKCNFTMHVRVYETFLDGYKEMPDINSLTSVVFKRIFECARGSET